MSSRSVPQAETPLACPVPPPGTLAEVAPGVRWLRMPLPFVLNHINLWVLDDQDDQGEPGVTLIDTGLADPATQDLWDQVFAGPLAGQRVLRVICTHFHPDHMGLAGWLCQRLQVPLYATLGEWGMAHFLSSAATPWDDTIHGDFYLSHGVDAETCATLRQRANGYRDRTIPPPQQFHRLINGDRLLIGERTWTVVVGYGHAPEHACLLGQSPLSDAHQPIFISGDQVLPRITPNISVWPNDPESDPLHQYLRSLDMLSAVIPEDSLTLPSHGQPFSGVLTRIDEIKAHHDDRLKTVYASCGEPCCAMDLIPVMFARKLDAHQLSFALGEALSHLHILWKRGELRRFRDAHGVIRFVHPTAWKP